MPRIRRGRAVASDRREREGTLRTARSSVEFFGSDLVGLQVPEGTHHANPDLGVIIRRRSY